MLLAPFLEQATPSAISSTGSLTVQAEDEAAADALEMAKTDMLAVVKGIFPAVERVIIARPSGPSVSGSHKRVTEKKSDSNASRRFENETPFSVPRSTRSTSSCWTDSSSDSVFLRGALPPLATRCERRVAFRFTSDAWVPMADIMKILQQAQQMQGRLKQIQDELEARTVNAASGGGMVTVEADGKGKSGRSRSIRRS
jgi:hypothetical protein